MRVGIIVLTDSTNPRPQDLLRAEYLAASVRQSQGRHVASCLAVRLPADPAAFAERAGELDAHALVYFVPPAHAVDVTPLTEAAYRQNPNRPQFLAGPWPTIEPELAIKAGPINGLIRGECDLVLGRLLNSLSDREELMKIPGVWLRKSGGPHRGELGMPPAADQIPIPDFNGFNWPQLGAMLRGALPVEASRGYSPEPKIGLWSALRRAYPNCPDNVYYRLRSVEDTLQDIQTARLRFDPLKLQFVDEVFPSAPEWLAEFCERHPMETGLPFSAWLTPEGHGGPSVIESLADAGLTECHVWVVCGDEGLRGALLPYNQSNDAIHDLVRRARARGARVSATVFVGLPFETREQMKKTEQFLRASEFDAVSVRVYEPTPGSAMSASLAAEGLIDQESGGWSNNSAAMANRMDVGHYADRIFRFNLEKQAADYQAKRGQHSFIESLPEANHRARDMHGISIQRRGGQPAFTQCAPSESAFSVTVKPGSVIKGAVEFLGGGPGESGKGTVLAEVIFAPDDGGPETTLFSTRLSADGEGRAEFRESIEVASPVKGLLIFSARDAGLGNGLFVCWVEPVMELPVGVAVATMTNLEMLAPPIDAPKPADAAPDLDDGLDAPAETEAKAEAPAASSPPEEAEGKADAPAEEEASEEAAASGEPKADGAPEPDSLGAADVLGAGLVGAGLLAGEVLKAPMEGLDLLAGAVLPGEEEEEPAKAEKKAEAPGESGPKDKDAAPAFEPKKDEAPALEPKKDEAPALEPKDAAPPLEPKDAEKAPSDDAEAPSADEEADSAKDEEEDESAAEEEPEASEEAEAEDGEDSSDALPKFEPPTGEAGVLGPDPAKAPSSPGLKAPKFPSAASSASDAGGSVIKVTVTGRVFVEGKLDERVRLYANPPAGMSDRRDKKQEEEEKNKKRPKLPSQELEDIAVGSPREAQLLRLRCKALEKAFLERLERLRQTRIQVLKLEAENARLRQQVADMELAMVAGREEE